MTDGLGECKNVWCGEPATEQWKEKPHCDGFGVCRGCKDILIAGTMK